MSSLLFEDKSLTIQYEQDQKYLQLVWKGFIPSHAFRSLACEIIKAVEKTKAKKILSDNTEWKIISPNDQGWAANHWFPKAEESGVMAMATVMSRDIFNRQAERNVEGLAAVSTLKVGNFETVKEAVDWLATVGTIRPNDQC